MEQSSSPPASPSPSPVVLPTWRVGHAVTSSSRCCTAFRGRYVVYAATDNSIALVDVLAEHPSSLSAEARWRYAMRLRVLASPDERISFVVGHPEKDLLCVGTAHHGLYLTSLTNPALTEATKLPRTVTGDCTYGATFLFTEEANYLAFSSLLHSRPLDQTPHRLSLWSIDTKALLWRGAMGPLQSMCSLAFDLSFAACSAGKIGLFSVQYTAPAATGGAEAPADGQAPKHRERNRLMVLSRHCSTVEELCDVEYTCCMASPVEGEETYLALASSGFLVAFNGSTGSVVRWMDCKVSSATALCCVGKESLMLTGSITRLFQAETWEFQGKVKWQDVLGAATSTSSDDAGATKEVHEDSVVAASGAHVFTNGASAGNGVLVLFHEGGAFSLYSMEPKTGTQRMSLRRASVFTPPILVPAAPAEIWPMNSALWCWWTPQALMFVSPPGCTLVTAFGNQSTCATLHPAAGVVVLFDTARHALVAYGRAPGTPAELGSAATNADENIVSLASSPTGDVVYALTTSSAAAAASWPSGLQLRRYRCCWAQTPKGGSGVGSRALQLERIEISGSASVPAGTHALVVYSGGDVDTSGPESTATDADRVVAVQRASITALGNSAEAGDHASAPPTYTHADAIQHVVPCQGGLIVAGAVTSAYVQAKGASRWVVKSLAEPPAAQAVEKESGANVCVVATVVMHRPDIVVVCRGSRLSAWQLNGDNPLLIATRAISTLVRAICSAEDKENSELLVWTLGSGCFDLYKLGPLHRAAALHNDAEKLLPPPKEVAKKSSAAPSSSTAPPPAPSAAQASNAAQRRPARTPLAPAVKARGVSKAVSEARRQRRTASASAPSSRELSDRFDELTGFYARQKRDSQAGEHARTPRSAGPSRHPHPSIIVAAEASVPSSQDDSVPALSRTPRDRQKTETPADPPATANLAASAVDVSELTVDSQVLRAGVAAAADAGVSGEFCVEDANEGSRNGSASASPKRTGAGEPAACPDSPPQRRNAQRGSSRLLSDAEDAVIRSSTSSRGAKPSFLPLYLKHEERLAVAAKPHRGPNGSSSSTMTTEQFTVHARHLRESLLHLKELLEHSDLPDSASNASFSATEEAELDELPDLLTTVAAQLQLRQVRRSGESAHANASRASSAVGEQKPMPDAYAAVAAELARIQAQNARLEEQNRIILTQLRGGSH
ncbi:conserved hypothetical protein [Leishmania infantum JPCM5]|uniref:Uncharacterized protein n=2 Tax=Leishmania infantum TaxID=5671 RepID=A4HVT4_LEIIN|nr:conserved hypothetical protein [Leishmania infantum JPCM5]CAC9467032.1 hypothetical_protein_-_conserved [Leishmania infantum]CAM66552.1 conserved hypothetical protein [Leishmania infantum JPCM5]SUZ40209.1 hypothetical_protein_-_conserved [Leishmania infantum]|eukprot:XP_001464175.1 conserved hypothetical protein [Leishmania infantum JPCM5]